MGDGDAEVTSIDIERCLSDTILWCICETTFRRSGLAENKSSLMLRTARGGLNPWVHPRAGHLAEMFSVARRRAS